MAPTARASPAGSRSRALRVYRSKPGGRAGAESPAAERPLTGLPPRVCSGAAVGGIQINMGCAARRDRPKAGSWPPPMSKRAPARRPGSGQLRQQPKQQLEAWFHQTLAALDPRALLQPRLACLPQPATGPYQHLAVFAFGKAAGPMLNGWLQAAANGLSGRAAGAVTETWIALPPGAPGVQPKLVTQAGARFHAFEAGHPEPNAQSLAAAEAMLTVAHRLASGPPIPSALVALISGGGSALVEAPLEGGLEDARQLYRALVRSGASIGEINTVRRHHSRFKAGRLAAAAAAAHVAQFTWVLSDVSGDRLGDVASGPTFPDASTAAEARAVLERWLPGEAAAVRLEETPKPGDAVFARSQWECLAGNGEACAATAARARAAGYDPVVIDGRADEWESGEAAAYLAARWRALRALYPRPCLIAGGEVRVRVPSAAAGRGGRNQHLALQVAQALAGIEFCFLSAGTDGIDGSSDAAGACVDGKTCARARARGFDCEAHLRGFDAEPLLAATGSLIRTGPTGNNLRDLRIFI